MSIHPLPAVDLSIRENPWNNLDLNLGSHLLIAIVGGGVVGPAIEQGMHLIARRFDYRSN
ncbi:MAG: hypothetical protein C0434_03545 [Xanthomonadaceae bacterium]|nr:hypothetical protein [Xanthomonadaceae bacterium]